MNDGFLPGLGRFLVFLLRTPQTQLPQAKKTDRATEVPSDCERGRQSGKDAQTDDGNEKHSGSEATSNLV